VWNAVYIECERVLRSEYFMIRTFNYEFIGPIENNIKVYFSPFILKKLFSVLL